MGSKPSLARVAAALTVRGFQEASRQRLSAALSLLSMLVAMLSFFFLGRYVGPAASGVDRFGGYFGFAVVGLAGLDLFATVATAPARRIREAQLTGTLDAMLATPAPEAWVVVLLAAWDLCGALLRTVAYLVVAAFAFGVTFEVQWLTLAMGMVLALLAFVPLGLLGAALTMLLRRGDPLSLFMTMGSSVFGAVIYPVEALPPWARVVAEALPLTHALAVWRAALFEAASPLAVARSMGMLGVLALALGAVGAGAFFVVLRRARMDGSLTSY